MNARFFLAGADDVEAGPDEAGLLDDSPPPLPLQLLLPLPRRCSVAEVEGGGATLIEGGGTATAGGGAAGGPRSRQFIPAADCEAHSTLQSCVAALCRNPSQCGQHSAATQLCNVLWASRAAICSGDTVLSLT